MDPNVTLDRLRSLLNSWEEWGTLEHNPAFVADEASDLFFALDDWIVNGGFLPDEWRTK